MQRGKTRVETAARHEFGVAALAHDAALIHHHDALETLDGGEAMGDHDGGAPGHEIVEPRLHQLLILGIERTRRFVEQQKRRIAQDRAGDREALALSTGQCRPAFADQCSVGIRQPLDELRSGSRF